MMRRMWNKAVRWLGRVLTAEYATTWAARLLGPKLVLAVVLVVVALLLLPVPPLVLDALLIANLLLGVGLLGLAVQAGTPERLPQLPALLVVSIVLRLGLNVTAVRLILGQGYAGRVIAAFGSSMAGGDLVLGLAVLLVLATVQYLVLARGGERVAEVAARFILDALPGRQAAIEADLRAGVLTPGEAQAQRVRASGCRSRGAVFMCSRPHVDAAARDAMRRDGTDDGVVSAWDRWESVGASCRPVVP